ncbi:MAG: transcription antitermination factor NusB [Commensalibacter sp.]
MIDTRKNIETRPRTLSRIAAVQAIFQWEQGDEKSASHLIEQFLLYRTNKKADYNEGQIHIGNKTLFSEVVKKVIQNGTQIDQYLSEALPDEWPLNRLDPVLRALLRAGSAELMNPKEPPTRVVINEYIDVAHSFFDGDESRMVNGVLDTVARRLRSEEQAVV